MTKKEIAEKIVYHKTKIAWHNEQIEKQAIDLYAEGLTILEIANLCKKSQSTISAILHRAAKKQLEKANEL